MKSQDKVKDNPIRQLIHEYMLKISRLRNSPDKDEQTALKIRLYSEFVDELNQLGGG